MTATIQLISEADVGHAAPDPGDAIIFTPLGAYACVRKGSAEHSLCNPFSPGGSGPLIVFDFLPGTGQAHPGLFAEMYFAVGLYDKFVEHALLHASSVMPHLSALEQLYPQEHLIVRAAHIASAAIAREAAQQALIEIAGGTA